MTRQWHVVWSSLCSPVQASMSRTWLAGTQTPIVISIYYVITLRKAHEVIWGQCSQRNQLNLRYLPPPGLLRSTVHPLAAAMVPEWSRCWRSCPLHNSVTCISQPGTSLTVGAPLGMEGPWGRLPSLWLFMTWLTLKGWAESRGLLVDLKLSYEWIMNNTGSSY